MFSTTYVYPINSRLYSSGELTCNLVESFSQDTTGFIWIATQYGLNKFDGMHFTHYLHNEKDSTSLLGNYVHALKTDSKNTLWVGCSNGLQYYMPEENAFRTVYFENTPIPHVVGITELHTGEIWVLTSGRGVFTVNKEKCKATLLSTITDACGSKFLAGIYEDKKKNIWIGTNNSGCIKIDAITKKISKLTLITAKNGWVGDFAEDVNGNIYACSATNIEVLNLETNQFSPIKYIGSDDRLAILDMSIDQKGTIYVATDGQGLKYIDINTNTLRDVENEGSTYNLDNAIIHSIFEDKDQNMWLACFYAGALMIPNETKQFDFWSFTKNRNKIGGTVTSICKDYQGFVWCSVDNEGVFKFNRQGKIVTDFSHLKSVLTIYEDSKKTFWISTNDKGVGKLNTASGIVNYLPAFNGKRIKYFAEDDLDNLYLSEIGKGLYRMNLSNGSMTHFEMSNDNDEKNVLKNNWINTLLKDKDGLLWIGHYKGVDCYDTKNNRFKELKFWDVISKNICISLLEIRNGNIAIGTNNGLFIYDKKSGALKQYTTKDGLSNNVISGLADDENGNIWCSTYNGINQLNLTNGKIVNYYSGNGLSGNEYTSGAYFKDNEGLIYFGGNFGITSFAPQNITQRNYERKVIIANFYLQGEPVNKTTLSNRKKVIDTTVSDTHKFKLSYTDNTFTVEFSTMDFVDQENIIYAYRLKQLNKNWQTTLPGVNRVTFNYLQSGNYTLEVKASKNGSYSPVSVYDIYISYPWYKSFFAYILYALIFSAMVFLLIKFLRQKRDKQINEAKFQYFINISHEIRSPMTLIISPLEKLLKETYDESTTKALQTIHRNANRVLGLINQLLDVRKFDKGQMQIKCSETDLVEFIEEVLKVFEYQAKSRHINLSFEHNMNKLPVWIDRNNFDKVLINLLSNSFKYTPNSGDISLILTTGIDEKSYGALHNYIEIRILDSGIGLENDKIDKIFDRFYQIGNDVTFSSIGTGIGLNLCRILVELHHGVITASNRVDTRGSKFTIRIPLAKDHLHKNEIATTVTDFRPALQNFSDSNVPELQRKKVKSKTNYKILIADDEPEIREFLCDELEEMYKLITCGNGNEALRLIHIHQPDVIISDIMMPEMDGFTLLKKIRSNANISHIPVILLTSKIEHQDRMEGLEGGAEAYLSKPFNTDELQVIVSNLIANRKLLKNKFSGVQDQVDKIKPVEFKSSDEILMDNIMNFVNNNISNPELNVEMLAQTVGLSRAHLHRKIKEMTGIATAEFIRNLRLKQAAILLQEKKINITQIAFAVGFTNQTNFYTAFKKFYGMSPSEYIQQAD